MTADEDKQLHELKGRTGSRETLERRQVKARDAMVQADYRLKALELNLDQCREEVARLEGFSLTGLMSALAGRKQQRLALMREQCAALEKQYTECEATLAALQREVGEIERELAQARSAAAEYKALLARKEEEIAGSAEGGEALRRVSEQLSAARVVVESIQKAIDAGDEALRDLHAEQQTASTLGRCRVADARGVLSTMMNASRHGTADECAARVSRSLRRFHTRLCEVMARESEEGKEALAAAGFSVEALAANFAGHWLASGASGEQSAGHVERELINANMLLEKHLADAQGCVASHERERRQLIESA